LNRYGIEHQGLSLLSLTEDMPVTSTQYYTWQDYPCAYELYTPEQTTADASTPLLLIHPIGVGLSRQFWERFCRQWVHIGQPNPIYNPDLLGCGASAMPHIAYTPIDWAQQLQHFIETVIQKPVILVAQGALLPVAISLIHLPANPSNNGKNWIQGLVLAGPPAWALITQGTPAWRHRVGWNLLNSPLGNIFYRYARRRRFLHSFSVRQLFAAKSAVDDEWLDTLEKGAVNPASRHAVFSFLAGFWRQDYGTALTTISQPALVVFGKCASSISRTGEGETPDRRLESYLAHLPNSQGTEIPGRNVLPYESTTEFAAVTAAFVNKLG